MMGPRRRTWPDFSPYKSEEEYYNETEQIENLSIRTNTNSELVTRKRDSTGSYPAWSVTSLLTSSCAFSNDGKESTSSDEGEEEICDVADLRSLYQPTSEIRDFKVEEEDVEQEYSPKRMSFSSSGYRSLDTCQPLLGMPLLAVTEELVEEEIYSGSNINEGDIESSLQSPIHGHLRLMARPKPYHTFLDEIKKKELEDQFNAWKEAKHLKLMSKLRKKEAIINAWELKKTKKATLEMKRIEGKLEREKARTLDRMEMKFSKAQRKAEEKKKREKRSTVNKIEMVSRVTEKIRSTENPIWFKLLCFW
ncbi:hypothetical protein GIB67_001215 [Kingdonia uniflora]|uniref:Remorin C-terminal domain-containing protein n=1 Tax=Kingdonia uniflora TaxID=39325 RepID=A0A7J7LGB4_9MAGN|nr:hypothetical protein GIB67_001215 [Kingdonia uniflora]